jgi:hypothetical protein
VGTYPLVRGSPSASGYYCTAPNTFDVAAALDNGPSFIFIDGNTGPNASIVGSQSGGTFTTVAIPAGKFALSVIACSNDGPSLGVSVSTPFISATNSNLTIDYARTFHYNGN